MTRRRPRLATAPPAMSVRRTTDAVLIRTAPPERARRRDRRGQRARSRARRRHRPTSDAPQDPDEREDEREARRGDRERGEVVHQRVASPSRSAVCTPPTVGSLSSKGPQDFGRPAQGSLKDLAQSISCRGFSRCVPPPRRLESSSMPASAETRAKLDRVRDDLRREFPCVAGERFDEHVDAVISGFLAQARFADFVPLLVARNARARLATETATESYAGRSESR